jgi:predicted nucleic acid-binding protein
METMTPLMADVASQVRDYLDTSLITAATSRAFSHHEKALAFSAESVIAKRNVLVSEFMRVEYGHHLRVVERWMDRQSFRSHGLHRWDRESIRRRWVTQGMTALDAFLHQFASVQEVSLSRDIIDQAAEIMVICNLDSYDAAHVATALTAGASRIVTLDRELVRARSVIDVFLIPDDMT